MPASSKKGRDNSGHSGHANKYRGSKRPESVSRVFPTRDQKWGANRLLAGDPALDCAVKTTRPMSRAGRTVA